MSKQKMMNGGKSIMTYHVAVVGATGMVGRKMLEILEEYDFPVASLTLLASPRSAGQTLVWRGGECAAGCQLPRDPRPGG